MKTDKDRVFSFNIISASTNVEFKWNYEMKRTWLSDKWMRMNRNFFNEFDPNYKWRRKVTKYRAHCRRLDRKVLLELLETWLKIPIP